VQRRQPPSHRAGMPHLRRRREKVCCCHDVAVKERAQREHRESYSGRHRQKSEPAIACIASTERETN